MYYYYSKKYAIMANRKCLSKEENLMGMTMTQKILAAAAGLDHVEAGQLIEAELDLVRHIS